MMNRKLYLFLLFLRGWFIYVSNYNELDNTRELIRATIETSHPRGDVQIR